MKQTMTIQCESLAGFAEMIYWCVAKGLTFHAHTRTLIIELTGGF
jgi:hypothetical protein